MLPDPGQKIISKNNFEQVCNFSIKNSTYSDAILKYNNIITDKTNINPEDILINCEAQDLQNIIDKKVQDKQA